jgi:DNA mismatch repair protein MutS
VREYGDKVIFLHKVLHGFADHSYGIQVAQMAGLPEEVTDRAKQILKNLEQSDLTFFNDAEKDEEQEAKIKAKHRTGKLRLDALQNLSVQMTLFAMKDNMLAEELKKIDIDSLTPIQALNILVEIKLKLEGRK